jgi:hypothetical protein
VIVARKLLVLMSGADTQGALTSNSEGQPPTNDSVSGQAVAIAPATEPEKQVLRWLQPGEQNGERIAIVSYPRSGNSLMRGLLEKITGVYTGCDTRPDRALSQELQQYGMKGEVCLAHAWWQMRSCNSCVRLRVGPHFNFLYHMYRVSLTSLCGS